jgi:AcrR family transcriptional regulator
VRADPASKARQGRDRSSLYHHFRNRSDLLTVAARDLLSAVPLGDEPALDRWKDWFIGTSMTTYRTILKHPRADGLLFTYFPNTLIMPAHERGARLLAELGVPAESVYMVLRAHEKMVFGMAFADADDLVRRQDSGPSPVDAERWPTMARAMSESVSNERMVDTALLTFFAGVEASLAR